MRLYLTCHSCFKKVILDSKAKTRDELAAQWGYYFTVTCPHCQYPGHFNVKNVMAEASTGNAATGAIIGGLIGLLFGPEGALIGSAIGGGGGLVNDENEKQMVRRFNNS